MKISKKLRTLTPASVLLSVTLGSSIHQIDLENGKPHAEDVVEKD